MQWNKCQTFTWEMLRESHWKELDTKFGTDLVGVGSQDVRDFEKRSASSADPKYSLVPRNWVPLPYYEAYSMLYRIENALRVFVYLVLKNAMGINWRLAKIADTVRTIDGIAKQKQEMAAAFGHLPLEYSHPVLALTCDELTKVMFDDSQWKHFSRHFPAKKDIIRSKFEEVIQVRNQLAHFKPANNSMSDLVRHNAEQLLPLAEKYLNQAIYQDRPLESNYSEKWYGCLKDVLERETRFFRLHPAQSADREWIKIILATTYQIRNDTGHRVTPEGLLSISPSIREAISYLYEDYRDFFESGGLTSTEGNFSDLSSESIEIHMVFSKAQLGRMCDKIRDDLQRILTLLERDYLRTEDDELFNGDLLKLITFGIGDITLLQDNRVIVKNFFPREVGVGFSDVFWPAGWYPDEPADYISSAWWYPFFRREL